MAIKIRVLTVTKKEKMKELADKISKKADCYKPVDIIPPAYTCDRERLVIVVLTAAKTMSDDFRRFIQDVSREKIQNIAFIVDGAQDAIAPILETVRKSDTNLIDNVLYIDGGSSLPFFGAKLKPEEEAEALAWCEKIVENLK